MKAGVLQQLTRRYTNNTSAAENKPSASIQGVHKGTEKKQAKMEGRMEVGHGDRILRHDRPQIIQ
jgi:hypothetical protein